MSSSVRNIIKSKTFKQIDRLFEENKVLKKQLENQENTGRDLKRMLDEKEIVNHDLHNKLLSEKEENEYLHSQAQKQIAEINYLWKKIVANNQPANKENVKQLTRSYTSYVDETKENKKYMKEFVRRADHYQNKRKALADHIDNINKKQRLSHSGVSSKKHVKPPEVLESFDEEEFSLICS